MLHEFINQLNIRATAKQQLLALTRKLILAPQNVSKGNLTRKDIWIRKVYVEVDVWKSPL